MKILRALALCLFCLTFAACQDSSRKQAQSPLPPPLVGVLEMQALDVPIFATFMGQTAGSRSAAVKPQVTGILLRRLFEEGARVEQGDPLFEIDPAPFQAELERAQGELNAALSTLENARKEYGRVRRLFEENAVSRQTRDNAQASFLSAQAQTESTRAAVESARIQLGYCRVLSPLSGWTGREVSTEGSLVGPESTLTFVHQSDPMDVHFAVPSAELFSMRDMEARGLAESYGQGSSAQLLLLEGVEYAESGKVIFLDTQVYSSTSAIRAKARFPNPRGELMPGQFAAVRVGGARLLKALLLPQEAVKQTAGGAAVFVVDKEGIVSLVPVRLGPAFGAEFLVEEGLSAGQRVVVEGRDKVTPGGKVQMRLMERRKGGELETASSQQPVMGQSVEDAPAPLESRSEAEVDHE